MTSTKCSPSRLNWVLTFSIAATLAIALLASGCGGTSSGGATVRSGATPADTPHGPAVTAAGFADVAFGTSEETAQAGLVKLLGAPKKDLTDSGLPKACHVSSSAEWDGFTAFYFNDSFTGYEYRGADLQGPDGLNVGMSAAAAKEVEGKAFSTSAAQGGSWLLNTSSGKLFGYLDGVTSKARIASIDAGSVGCAAMTP
ncbi:MAG TPA: hypothetical protein VHB18_02790 [Mycobacteriales bacterium]|nr:hypothetical protein [Mycobacteriales bacterium]